MYERYYGFAEKPFSLTPDPKYLYRSQSHANAFDLLQYAIQRREGFVVVTGDIGTGKTTLCRALLEQIDRTTYTALVLNPFLTEADLLKKILQDFGVVSREELKAGALAQATKQDLIDSLYDFLLGLIDKKACAVLIIDEAQNLPPAVLEQIRILSNLETDKEKLLQIILVGQCNLQAVLRSPDMRQLDQRVSIRYELTALDREAVAAYITHRLTIAGGSSVAVTFASDAIDELHRRSGGIPRLINLMCDRALLAGFAARTSRITVDMVVQAAGSLDVQTPSAPPRTRRVATTAAAAAVVFAAAGVGVGGSTWLYQLFAAGVVHAESTLPSRLAPSRANEAPLPAGASQTILVGSYPIADSSTPDQVRALAAWLDGSGYRVFHAEVDLGVHGRWHRVLAGAYTDAEVAEHELARLQTLAPSTGARLVSAGFATGMTP
jgi:general secretion pathway protein A